MCGIVGAVAARNVTPILMEGLRRLEYRGYDSAGLAVLGDNNLSIVKEKGKVAELSGLLKQKPISGVTGIAHTRWATHGKPSADNAHPHRSGGIAVIHNGIIENHESLRIELISKGFGFLSETDTEVIVHLLSYYREQMDSMLPALETTLKRLEGAYAICVVAEDEDDYLYIARQGSPLVIGKGIEENFVASDQLALRPVTDRFIFLEEGDFGRISREKIELFNAEGEQVDRVSKVISEDAFDSDKGQYRHFMLKEIYEQPEVIRRTLDGRIGSSGLMLSSLGLGVSDTLAEIKSLVLVACGTSYHACMVAKHWIEEILELPVQIEIGSEYRYKKSLVPKSALFVTVSQSGETADTLAALRKARTLGYLASLAICNVANSSIVRESDYYYMTHAGPEIGVASTKAFTTQLVSFLMLTAAIARAKQMDNQIQLDIVSALKSLPRYCEQVLQLDQSLKMISEKFLNKFHALFLGRGEQYPVAKEGALKLKEISYIHAEAYPAGELKHGPLALVDENMPVIAVAPNNEILAKIKSNLEEVRARGGQLFVFADGESGFESDEATQVIKMPHMPALLEPILYSIPLQLLSYHVAIVKGTDVDQPRNLAKSVTVE